MKAEIISVGTELLLGHTINTDAAFVARELAALGYDLMHVQVVGDNPARLEEALRNALERSDIVITTGGLGPTKDDLTKEIIARVAGVPLVRDDKCMAALREYFGKRPMTENQLKQALIPQNATVFPNPCGTAPGCAVPCGEGKFALMLPGPPGELVPMLENHARPFLLKLGHQAIHSNLVRTFGIGEGAAAQMLDDIIDNANPTIATYAAAGEMFVKITAKSVDEQSAKDLAEPLTREVCERLGDVVYGINIPNLEYLVVRELVRQKIVLGTAESCTGGLLAKRITDQPGASAVFHFGAITYANEAKEKILGVAADTLRAFGAVSPQTAREMAEGIRSASRADLGIGITGIAGPDGATPEKPLGLVYISLATAKKTWIHEMKPKGRYPGREAIRTRATSTALDMVRRYLAGMEIIREV